MNTRVGRLSGGLAVYAKSGSSAIKIYLPHEEVMLACRYSGWAWLLSVSIHKEVNICQEMGIYDREKFVGYSEKNSMTELL